MRRLLEIVLPLLVFFAALAAGAWLSIGRRATAFSAGVEQRIAEAASAKPAIVAPTERAFPSDEEMLGAIMSAVSEEEPLLRAHLLHATLARLSSAELAALFTRATQLDDRERRGTLLGVLLARWVAVDPAAAEAAVSPYLHRLRAAMRADWQSLDTVVAEAWARAMPERALAEAMMSPEAAWANKMAEAALNSLAEGDPAKQLEALARLPANRLREDLCKTAIWALAEKDSAAAEARLDLLPDARKRARVQAAILGKLAGRDPAAGLARLTTLAPALQKNPEGMRMVTEILRGVAKKDPAAALASIEGLPEELQKSALGSALVGWADENPVDALTWGAANGVELSEVKSFLSFGDDGGTSWQNLGSIAFEKDRAKTLAWLRTQPASVERDALLGQGIWNAKRDEKLQIYAELTPQGQAAAAENVVRDPFGNGGNEMEAWVKAQPPGAARKAAIQALAQSQAFNAPERLDALTADWPAAADRDAATRGIVSYLTNNNNPRRAVEFARGIGNPAARESAFERIAQNWIYSDEPAARAWIASAPELSAEQKRVLLRQVDDR